MKRIFTLFAFTCISLSASAQVPSGYAVYYPFTGNCNDSSGHNLHASGINTSFVADRFGHANSAVYFNGTNAKAISPYMPTGISAFTFCVWVKTDAMHTGIDKTHQLLDFRGQAGSGYYGLDLEYWEYDGTYTFGLGGDNVWKGQSLTYNNNNTWMHIACVWNPAGASQFAPGQFSLYINGVLQATVPNSSNPLSQTLPSIPFSANAGMALGAIGTTGNIEFYRGAMDDMFIYQKALTPAQIDSVYNSAPLSVENTINKEPVYALYPNPATDRVYLSGYNKADGPVSIAVLNTAGQLVMAAQPHITGGGDISVDISHLNTGIYYMAVIAEKTNYKQVLKIVKE